MTEPRIVVYRTEDRGEIDFKYLAVAVAPGGRPVEMAAGPTEAAARLRLQKALLLS